MVPLETAVFSSPGILSQGSGNKTGGQCKHESVAPMGLGISAPGNTLTGECVIWSNEHLSPAPCVSCQFSALDTSHLKGSVLSSGQWLLKF